MTIDVALFSKTLMTLGRNERYDVVCSNHCNLHDLLAMCFEMMLSNCLVQKFAALARIIGKPVMNLIFILVHFRGTRSSHQLIST